MPWEGHTACVGFLFSFLVSSVFGPWIPLLFSAVHHCSCPQQAKHDGHLPAELVFRMDVHRMDCRPDLGGESGCAVCDGEVGSFRLSESHSQDCLTFRDRLHFRIHKSYGDFRPLVHI